MMCKHLSIIFLLASGALAQAEAPLIFTNPAVNNTNIVFSHAGDLWVVGRAGGEARRLTSGVGVETSPRISPDGATVAFTGEYEGNYDVYVVPVTGGVPKRLTYHPGADFVSGWSPDGKVLFSSFRNSQTGRTAQLFTINPNGVWPELIPLPMAHDGSFSPDGKYLAYEPMRRAFNAWKRYRGGTASYLWIADIKDSSVTKIPRTDSNDFCPMWIGQKVYFLSDRQGPITLYSYDTNTKQVERLINNTGLDFKSASAGPGVIAYEQFGTIFLYDIATAKSSKVDIRLEGDMPGLRQRFESLDKNIMNFDISPNGARAVFEARGEIFTVPAEKGSVRNITGTPGIAERNPAWSPDGKSIAYFSDASGEYALHIAAQDGSGVPRKIALEPSFYYNPTWSPDSKKIVFIDKRLNVWLLDLEKGKPEKLDTLERGDRTQLVWAPDSKWITYTKPVANEYEAVFVCELQTKKITQITDGMSKAMSPVFDQSGKYLFFATSTNVGPAMSGFDMTAYPHNPTESVYLVVLKKGEPSPLAHESDEEKPSGSQSDAKPADAKPASGKSVTDKPEDKKPVEVKIDFDGLDQRIVALPITNKRIVDLACGKPGTLLFFERPTVIDPASFTGLTLQKFDMKTRKLEKVVDGIQAGSISANGEKALLRIQDNWFIVPSDQAPKPTDAKLRVNEMEARVDPKAEWAQMYREAWRIQRDYFYDPGYHGLDIKAAEAKYAPYVDGLRSRADLNYLFNEMFGDLTVGHLYVGGGDMPSVKRVPGGLLGADLKVENGRYRFEKVYSGENWNPELRAPLTGPGIEVKAGEYLLAVNGHELNDKANPYQLLENKSDKQVLLRVGADPSGKGARDITVVPVASETSLRNRDWIETNRSKVAQATGGRIAYVWLPDTAGGGYTNFNRYWFAQLDKGGAVIDERFNGGGHAADYIIDYLKRPVNSYWIGREGDYLRQPFGAMPGPKVMMINEHAGSGGDYLPWMFRRAGIGPLIGKRTWGGVVGIGGYPVLMDGGPITAPHFAFFTLEGKFGIENEGVAPDIEVDLEPKAWREGRDTQLERAISEVMELLRKNPPAEVKKPEYPKYQR
jgi:tricorn protease